MIGHYDWAGGREAMLRFGPERRSDAGPVIVATMPLLEEWNRTRAFVVALLRALAVRGVASVLPDLPGHGESLVAVADCTLPGWTAALAAATQAAKGDGRVVLGLALRSGALIGPAAASWHFAPVTGEEMLRDLHRTWRAGGGDGSIDAMVAGDAPVLIAGTPVSPVVLASLAAAVPEPASRVVRLASDPRPADRHVEGLPLWRRAEPGSDPALVATLADDVARWVRSCAA